MKMKEGRLEMLNETLNKIKEISKLYDKTSPAWTLIQAAYGHINSLYFLEKETTLGEEILGVRFKDTVEKCEHEDNFFKIDYPDNKYEWKI